MTTNEGDTMSSGDTMTASARRIGRTLRHEVAHHLGWGERGVRELGL